MVTLKDFEMLQCAFIDIVTNHVPLPKALSDFFRTKEFSQSERTCLREFLFTAVQLKNRYRTMVERFSEQFPTKDDNTLDLRFFFVARFIEQRIHSSVEKSIQGILAKKSRIRKFVHYLRTTPNGQIFPSRNKNDPAFLWLYHSHPLWIIRKWLGKFSYGEVEKICLFNNSLPDVEIRINPLKVNREELLNIFKNEGIHCKASEYSPFGIVAEPKMDPLIHPLHRKSLFALQSISSQLTCVYINPKPGMRVLDWCAGEGGKTLTMSHLMKGKGEIFAHDVSLKKLQVLQFRMRKEGLSNIRLPGGRVIKKNAGTFDMVMCDVSCSGSGTFRRKPELKWNLNQKNLNEFNKLQLAILDEVSMMPKNGGFLFYVTCSLFQEENHKVIRRFLSTHKGWQLVGGKKYIGMSHREDFWIASERLNQFISGKYFQILPQRHSLQGMFCAVLQRTQ